MLLRARIREAWDGAAGWGPEPPDEEVDELSDLVAGGTPAVLTLAGGLQKALYPYTGYKERYWVKLMADGSPRIQHGR